MLFDNLRMPGKRQGAVCPGLCLNDDLTFSNVSDHTRRGIIMYYVIASHVLGAYYLGPYVSYDDADAAGHIIVDDATSWRIVKD